MATSCDGLCQSFLHGVSSLGDEACILGFGSGQLLLFSPQRTIFRSLAASPV